MLTRDELFDVAVGFVIGALALTFLWFIGWMLTRNNPTLPDSGQVIESEQ